MTRLLRASARFVPFSGLRVALLRLGGTRVGRGVSVARGVRVGERVVLGDSVRIGEGAALGEDISVGNKTRIGPRCHVGDDTVLGEGVTLSELSRVGNAAVGDGCFIEREVVMTGFRKGRISVGHHTYLGIGTILDWSGGLEIGNHVHISGPSVGVWTHSSVFQALQGMELGDRSQTNTSAVKIGDRVWIGGNSTVYPGTTISSFAVVLPNSVVNRDVSTGTVVGGAPATLKRRLHREGPGISFRKD